LRTLSLSLSSAFRGAGAPTASSMVGCAPAPPSPAGSAPPRSRERGTGRGGPAWRSASVSGGQGVLGRIAWNPTQCSAGHHPIDRSEAIREARLSPRRGRDTSAQGNALGNDGPSESPLPITSSRALKGRHKPPSSRDWRRPFRANNRDYMNIDLDPGRCPGLCRSAPLGPGSPHSGSPLGLRTGRVADSNIGLRKESLRDRAIIHAGRAMG
jgi:hypothetical protein